MTNSTASVEASAKTAQSVVPSVRTIDVMRLAWPTVMSFLLNNAYRMNDQFWVKGLGSSAQAALGSSFFVLVMNFSIYFLVIGGVLPLVAQATGAGDIRSRDGWIRHGLFACLLLSLVVAIAGYFGLDWIVGFLGLEGAVRAGAMEYLGVLYWFTLPMALAPTLESVFISMGHTRVPLVMQVTAVGLNLVLNPLLIFGSGEFAWLPFEGLGIEGAAYATVISKAVSCMIGLAVLVFRFHVRLLGGMRIRASRVLMMLRIGAPNSLSISGYAGVYWVVMALVVSKLGEDVIAALGLGLNVFEGISFPIFLGISLAGSSLVGRCLGAGSTESAERAVRRLRWLGGLAGVAISIAFLVFGPMCVPLLSEDPAVTRETIRYLNVLALSQVFVALESVHEKILLGSGHTRPIFWISFPGNALRIPLAWILGVHFELGAIGVWWAINLSTLVKATAFMLTVRWTEWTRPIVSEPLVDPAH